MPEGVLLHAELTLGRDPGCLCFISDASRYADMYGGVDLRSRVRIELPRNRVAFAMSWLSTRDAFPALESM